MSKYDNEADDFVPWYKRDSARWLRLSLLARGAAAEIARKVNRRGELHLGGGLEDLAFLLRLDWDREMKPALDELVAAGRIEWDAERWTLRDLDFEARKRKTSAERVRAHRAKKVGDPPEPGETTVTDVTPVTLHPNVTPETRPLSDLSLLSDLKISDPDLRSEDGKQEARQATPPAAPPDPSQPPAWFVTALGVIAMGTGVELPAAEAWLRYDGHRAGKGIAPTAKDAQYWLTTVMVPEVREARRRDARDGERTAAFVAQRAGPEVKAQPESKGLFREREAWEREAAPPDPETAAKMRALLGVEFGKVGT